VNQAVHPGVPGLVEANLEVNIEVNVKVNVDEHEKRND
jgi:hypothetical protein